jgi:hypothetical protein
MFKTRKHLTYSYVDRYSFLVDKPGYPERYCKRTKSGIQWLEFSLF